MKNHMAAGWFYSPSQIRHYFLTRISSLKPPKGKLRNPFQILSELSRHQWLMFVAGYMAWTCDAFDFFTVSLTATEIAADFNVSTASVSWGITITLMLRSVGALLFGFLSDRYGRKYPVIINLFLFSVLELASGFCKTLPQFLGVRSLYGIAMGGLYGPAAATALEDLSYESRGLLSGLYQQGYATGYVLAATFYRALVPTTSNGWRSLYWFGAGPPLLVIAFRLWLPETNQFQAMRAEQEAIIEEQFANDGIMPATGFWTYMKDTGKVLRANWVLFIYMFVLMTGFNSCSHGSQDLYPTFLKVQLGMSATDVTVVTVVGQISCVLGGVVVGYISTFFGRRGTLICACVFGGALLPTYVLPQNMSLVAGAVVEQFFVGGAWGPVPIHLQELAPNSVRALMVGLTYQLGNLASSASATIQATIGQRFPLPPTKDTPNRYDYGKVIGIFMAAVWVYLILCLLLGPEISQAERDEMAEETLNIERFCKEDFSFTDVEGKKEFLAAMNKAKQMESEETGKDTGDSTDSATEV